VDAKQDINGNANSNAAANFTRVKTVRANTAHANTVFAGIQLQPESDRA
jgi:hypothetical protein